MLYLTTSWLIGLSNTRFGLIQDKELQIILTIARLVHGRRLARR